MITAGQLSRALGIPALRAQQWIEPLNAAMHEFEINTPARIAMFLAQVGHESCLLEVLSENLNYSMAGLLTTFKRYFTSVPMAAMYQGRPEKIANLVYANRYGNGNEKSGDGWKYRGRGLIQTTFRDNYRACGQALGLDLEHDPDKLTEGGPAALSAGWYWKTHGCNEFADKGDFDGVCDMINLGHKTEKVGDANGYDHRVALWKKAQDALKGA